MHLVQPEIPRFDLEAVRALLGDDWPAVNREITARLRSDVALVNSVAHYIVGGGGKRLRPLITLLAARACGYRGDRHIITAAIIEFIHTATLLHDDVVDASDLRRGQDTANSVFGNEASVLVGDFLYSRAFQLMVQVGQMRIMDVLADATNTIAEGEVLQLMNCKDPETTEQRYMDVIYRKTATPLRGRRPRSAPSWRTRPAPSKKPWSITAGNWAWLSSWSTTRWTTVRTPGRLGKQVGDDLAEGKPTLPLIYALQRGSPKEQVMIRRAIERGGREDIRADPGGHPVHRRPGLHGRQGPGLRGPGPVCPGPGAGFTLQDRPH